MLIHTTIFALLQDTLRPWHRLAAVLRLVPPGLIVEPGSDYQHNNKKKVLHIQNTLMHTHSLLKLS